MNTLPKNVIFNIMKEWLPLKELVNFDSANTELKNRSNIRNIFKLRAFKLDYEINMNRWNVKWFLSNKIAVTNVVFDTINSQIILYFELYGSYIRRLSVLNNKKIINIVKYCPNLIYFKKYFADNELMTEIYNFCPNIQHLKIPYSSVDDDTLINFSSRINNLITLDLSGDSYLTNKSIVKIIENNHELKDICLMNCDIDDRTIISIAENCKDLVTLDLYGCQLKWNSLIKLSENCKYFESFKFATVIITDDLIDIILKYFKNIRKLDFSSTEITDDQLINVIKNLKNLKFLRLSGCRSLTKKSFNSMGENCFNMKKLDFALSAIDDISFIKIIENSKEIESLILSGCSRITDKSILAIVENCKNLKLLELNFCKGISKYYEELFDSDNNNDDEW